MKRIRRHHFWDIVRKLECAALWDNHTNKSGFWSLDSVRARSKQKCCLRWCNKDSFDRKHNFPHCIRHPWVDERIYQTDFVINPIVTQKMLFCWLKFIKCPVVIVKFIQLVPSWQKCSPSEMCAAPGSLEQIKCKFSAKYIDHVFRITISCQCPIPSNTISLANSDIK